MDIDQLCRTVADLVKDSEAYRDDRSVDRTRSQEYLDGEMKDTPSDAGRSKVVSKDVRSEIKKIIPSITRVLLRTEKVVEYEPVGADDEETAKQATDYVNYIALPESQGKSAIKDAIKDAVLLRNGVLKWWQDVRIECKYSRHSGLDEMAFAQLASDEAVEVLEHSVVPKQVDGVSEPVPLHDLKIKRKIRKSISKIGCVPLERFLIHPDAISFEAAPLLGENYRIRRSELVEMGYDRDKVDSLPVAASATTQSQEVEEQARRRDVTVRDEQTAKAMQEVEYYDLLVKIDFDDDGVAELRHLVFAGGLKPDHLLENDEWDEINYASVTCERRPHQWEGDSVSDDVMDIQRIKTVLLRQTLDNLYWQNNLQPIVQEGRIINPEAVTNPAFGQPIRIEDGTDVRAAVGYNTVPFVADKSFAMLEYLNGEKQDRTGISDASAGLPPDSLQNVTAKASAILEQSGIGQTEEIVFELSESLKPVFRGLLKLIVQHQDIPRTKRLRGKWVQFDPRTWNADMDATVNTGLGAGTRERDMATMSIVTGAQEKLLAAFGPMNNPFVKPNQLYNGVSKLVEATGLKSVDQYFSNPSPEELQAMQQAAAQKPSPEQEKAQGQVMVEQAKGQIQIAIKDKDIQREASKEREQRDADLIVKQAELERDTANKANEMAAEQARFEQEMVLRREEIASKERIEMAKLVQQGQIERERMEREDQRAERQRQTDMYNAQQQPEAVQ